MEDIEKFILIIILFLVIGLYLQPMKVPTNNQTPTEKVVDNKKPNLDCSFNNEELVGCFENLGNHSSECIDVYPENCTTTYTIVKNNPGTYIAPSDEEVEYNNCLSELANVEEIYYSHFGKMISVDDYIFFYCAENCPGPNYNYFDCFDKCEKKQLENFFKERCLIK